MKKIIVIPPKPQEPKKLKIAAYCRVSTLSLIQKCSLDWQIKSYTKIRNIRILWGIPVSMVKLSLFQSRLRLPERYLKIFSAFTSLSASLSSRALSVSSTLERTKSLNTKSVNALKHRGYWYIMEISG
ncbi:MAG: hypothetical protein K0R31_953 [Clostridiales bacterium]|nr:hypothetical protein [Clostridiales bacterium]